MSLEEKIGYTFRDKDLLELACTHRSYANENQKIEQNERLEFLGDAVLGIIVSHYLYETLGEKSEGELSQIRSSIVSSLACSEYIRHLELDDYLLLGRGEKQNGGKARSNLLADFFEALIGAIYLDAGFASAQAFFLRNFKSMADAYIQTPSRNWKAELQDYTQKHLQVQPRYTALSEEGPEHEKSFIISVGLDGKPLAQGQGSSKKEAEQAAAKAAVTILGEI